MSLCHQAWVDRHVKPVVVVNLDANGGKGERRWKKVAPRLTSILPVETQYILYRIPFPLGAILEEHVRKRGVNCIVSAGGDGTLNIVLNTLMKTDGIDPKDCYLGGIGLGSSNDFLKPAGMLLGNVPCRIRIEKSVLADVGKVVYTGEDGKERTHYFIVNSSLGITAEANRNFNRGGLPVQFLKPRLLGAAILCAAVKAILRFENIPVSLRVDGPPDGPQGPIDLRLSNLSVLKNPHVSGSYIYDQEIRADDGRLGLNYCSEMSTWELLRTLWDLRQGHFSGKARRVSMAVAKVQVHSDELIALELDGEVVMAKEICFALSQRRINLLG